MSRAAVSMMAFGAYLASGGLLLLLLPIEVCRILSISAPEGAWIRLTGMFFLILAFYCWRAAKEEERSFMRWSLYTRPATILFLIWFVASGWIEPIILVFGVVDLLATAWTLVALRTDS